MAAEGLRAFGRPLPSPVHGTDGSWCPTGPRVQTTFGCPYSSGLPGAGFRTPPAGAAPHPAPAGRYLAGAPRRVRMSGGLAEDRNIVKFNTFSLRTRLLPSSHDDQVGNTRLGGRRSNSHSARSERVEGAWRRGCAVIAERLRRPPSLGSAGARPSPLSPSLREFPALVLRLAEDLCRGGALGLRQHEADVGWERGPRRDLFFLVGSRRR